LEADSSVISLGVLAAVSPFALFRVAVLCSVKEPDEVFLVASFSLYNINKGNKMMITRGSLLFLVFCGITAAFVPSGRLESTKTRRFATSSTPFKNDEERRLKEKKEALLGLIGRKSGQLEGVLDPVLADPVTKEPVRINSRGAILAGSQRSTLAYDIKSSTDSYSGSSDSFLNLLEPVTNTTTSENTVASSLARQAVKSFTPMIPPPLRSALASMLGANMDGEYLPMRDLFTSPAVSYAYERGWRQGFARAGFPGPDREFEMAKEYFSPAVATSSVVVDMSCATGLFTRRFAKEDKYDRVLGCDYSESMLVEARRRINADPKLSNLKKTRLDLVRLDVGQIPMQDESVDALHAGAAMHCWPELEQAAKEIYRVLKPGGRYFATTFLSRYFSVLQASENAADGNAAAPSAGAFQYFESVDQLKKLMESGGFEPDKIQIEVLGVACVVIRCEK
jgi:ubiquinone/menaquinone biosynthesis C-methylase UbiE